VARAKPLTNHLAAAVLPHRFENAKIAGQRRKVNFRAGTTTRYFDGHMVNPNRALCVPRHGCLDERFHESCHMRGVISEFKIRGGDWMGTVDPSAA
jgi:hypothetical protein